MFSWLKKLLFKSNIKKTKDYKDPKTGQIIKSAVQYNKLGQRFLKFKDTDCALVIHEGGKIQVVFSPLYDPDNQQITPQEQTLMSIAIFLKQPGFAEMLRHEFYQIASRNINNLTQNKEQKKE